MKKRRQVSKDPTLVSIELEDNIFKVIYTCMRLSMQWLHVSKTFLFPLSTPGKRRYR